MTVIRGVYQQLGEGAFDGEEPDEGSQGPLARGAGAAGVSPVSAGSVSSGGAGNAGSGSSSSNEACAVAKEEVPDARTAAVVAPGILLPE